MHPQTVVMFMCAYEIDDDSVGNIKFDKGVTLYRAIMSILTANMIKGQ